MRRAACASGWRKSWWMTSGAARASAAGIIAAVHEKYNTAARYRLEVTESNVRASALYHMLGFEDLEYRQLILDTPPLG